MKRIVAFAILLMIDVSSSFGMMKMSGKLREVVLASSIGSSEDEVVSVDVVKEDDIENLKREILALCASCDRGFGASGEDRDQIELLLSDLSAMNPTASATNDFLTTDSPLRKCWRLVYTSASDVSVLGANPVFILGGIYQDARMLPTVINVIDARPKILALAPTQFAASIETLSRQKVFTTAKARGPNRIGLAFDRVEIEPKTFFGRDLPRLPFALGIDLPKFPAEAQKQLFDVANSIFGQIAPDSFTSFNSDWTTTDEDSDSGNPAYFDVNYLDEDFLVIQQASPGGVFAAVAVDQLSPP